MSIQTQVGLNILLREWPFHAFWDFCWTKGVKNGPEMGSFHLLEHPKGPGIILGKKRLFFFTHFRPIYHPRMVPFKGFWHSLRAIRSPSRLKPVVLASQVVRDLFSENVIFCPCGPVDRCWIPHSRLVCTELCVHVHCRMWLGGGRALVLPRCILPVCRSLS